MQIPSRDDPPSDELKHQAQTESPNTSHPINKLSTEAVLTTPAYIAFKDVETATVLFGKVEGCARPTHSLSSDKVYKLTYSNVE